jgi:hypothetical protein
MEGVLVKPALRILLTFVIAVPIIGGLTAWWYSYPVIIIGTTEFVAWGIPGGTERFEVNIPWPNTQIQVIVEVTDVLILIFPANPTGFIISSFDQQVVHIHTYEPGVYDTGWLDVQGACNITFVSSGYPQSYLGGDFVVWARSPITVLFHGDYLVASDHFQQQLR